VQAFGNTPFDRDQLVIFKIPKVILNADCELERETAEAEGQDWDPYRYFQAGAIMHGFADASAKWNKCINKVLTEDAHLNRSEGDRCLYSWVYGIHQYHILLTTDDCVELTSPTTLALEKRTQVRGLVT
jgi:hypothetical protein